MQIACRVLRAYLPLPPGSLWHRQPFTCTRFRRRHGWKGDFVSQGCRHKLARTWVALNHRHSFPHGSGSRLSETQLSRGWLP